MFNREHTLKETCQYFEDRKKSYTESANEKAKATEKEKEEFFEKLYKFKFDRKLRDAEFGKFTESVYNNNLETALEAIYISALEKVAPLTEESVDIAKSLVENYIKENGGAREIIRHKSGKTYLLDTIFEAVNIASSRDIDLYLEAEKDDEEEEKKSKKEEADGSDDVDKEDIKLGDNDNDGVDDSQDSDFGTGTDNDKNEEASDSKEKEDKPSSSDQNDEITDDEAKEKEDDSKEESEDNKEESEKESDENKEDDKEAQESKEEPEEDSTEEESEDDNKEVSIDDIDSEEVEDDEEEEGSDPVLDEPDTKESIEDAGKETPEMDDEEGTPEEDLPTSKEELFDKLENDAEVSDAVDIIAKRISDAETKFIEKNAEDKKKIENIVNKVQDRIDAVTNDEDSSEEDIQAEESEAKVEVARLTSQIRDDRAHTVFECMVRDNIDYIIKNKALTESYQSEGKIDMTRVIDNSRAMYGWLETINTIQLENVNEYYIKKLMENKI